MNPTEEQIQRDKRKTATAGIAAMPMATPGSPVAASAQSTGTAANSKTELIGGIPHVKLENPKYPGPLGMAADAMAGTIGYIATAPFGNRAEERLAANRAELNNETAEPQAKAKPAPSTLGITGGVQAVANQGVSDLAGRQAGHMIEENLRSFEDKGGGIVRQVGANGTTTFTNVDTANITDPAKKVAVNSYDGAADNVSLAKANAIRQELIDRQPAGGVGILGDGGVEAANAERTNRWTINDLQDSMKRAGTRAERAAIGQALAATIAGQTAQSVEESRSATAQRGQDVTSGIMARGQDIHATTEAARINGSPLDQQLKQAQVEGIGTRNESERQIIDLRKGILAETDPAKRNAMQEAMLVAQGRDPNQGRYIRMGGGEQVIDPLTGQKVRQPDQVFDSRTGQTVQSGKRGLTDTDFAAIGKKIGLPADALKARYAEFQKQGPATSLKDFNTVDVALALADGTNPEKIANTIKRLGGNPADYGI